jgi:hypothetical protein
MKTAYGVSLILSVVLVVIYFFQEKYTDFMYIFSNVFYPFIAGVAVIASAFALRKYWENLGDKFSRIWLGFTLGMVFWFLGELGWAIYALLLNVEIPYPSIADVAWLIGYFPLLIALHLYMRTFRSVLSKKMFAAAAVLIGIVSLAIFAFLVSPILEAGAEEEIITLTIDIAYPALDIALFYFSLLDLLIFAKGKMASAWLLISGAILMNVLGDIFFSYTTLQGTYYNGHFSELFFAWGYILFALAFYSHKKEL